MKLFSLVVLVAIFAAFLVKGLTFFAVVIALVWSVQLALKLVR